MADRQLKLPLNAKPVKRVVPSRLGTKRPMLATGNNETAGGAVVKPPALVVKVISGAPRPKRESK